jgi:hypothetical protein
MLEITILSLALFTPQDQAATANQAKPAEALVTTFFKHWKDGHATRSADILLGPEATVVGVGPHRTPKPWRKAAQDWLTEQEKQPPQHLELETTQVDLSAGSMAVVTARYTGYGYKGRAVFTLTWIDNRWKLATLVMTNHFNW